ncbi:hypothetical protein SynSYN20_01863 [Synechococcus sp. SYN20]|nr:hypothetical protein SynSYN20_01863 [Synechococcus sp. SYN20]
MLFWIEARLIHDFRLTISVIESCTPDHRSPIFCLDKLGRIWPGDAFELGFWLLGIEALVS